MYQKSLVRLHDRTPYYLQRKQAPRVVVDTPGFTQQSNDEYERNSFLDSQEGASRTEFFWTSAFRVASMISTFIARNRSSSIAL